VLFIRPIMLELALQKVLILDCVPLLQLGFEVVHVLLGAFTFF
jgi:hypothetical protein